MLSALKASLTTVAPSDLNKETNSEKVRKSKLLIPYSPNFIKIASSVDFTMFIFWATDWYWKCSWSCRAAEIDKLPRKGATRMARDNIWLNSYNKGKIIAIACLDKNNKRNYYIFIV